MALAWVFDRTNGQPVWPIPDVSVEQTDVPTEWTAKTQPIPSKPPAFDVVGIKTDDLIDFTPELREKALQAIKSGPYRLGGPVAPPSLAVPRVNKSTNVPPGFGGGGNWPAPASDSARRVVNVGSGTRPF